MVDDIVENGAMGWPMDVVSKRIPMGISVMTGSGMMMNPFVKIGSFVKTYYPYDCDIIIIIRIGFAFWMSPMITCSPMETFMFVVRYSQSIVSKEGVLATRSVVVVDGRSLHSYTVERKNRNVPPYFQPTQ